MQGFYNSGFGAVNIRLINNIVRIDAGSTGNKYALRFSDVNADITSNYNVLSVNHTAGNHYIGRFGGSVSGSNQLNLFDWKAVNAGAFDQNSIEADPLFSGPSSGDFSPNNIALYNYGLPLVPAITEDFLGKPRSPITPTPRALEFYNPSGIRENVLANSLSVYPNPSAGIFKVSVPQGRVFQAEVTDLTGRVILQQTAKTNTTQLNLSHAAKGVYLLKVSSEGATAVRRIIVE